MNDNIFIRTLEKMPKKDLRRFRDFSRSPYFNKHKDLRRLIDYLWRIHPRFDEKTCEKQRLFQEAFGADVFDEGKLAPLLTYSRRLLEEFWIYEEMSHDPFQKQLYLLQGLRKRELFPHYAKQFKKIQEQWKADSSQDTETYYRAFRMDREAVLYNHQIERHDDELLYQAKQENLDRFYILEKLMDACEISVRQKILRTGVQLRLLDAVLQAIETDKEGFEQVPAIATYYRIYLMLTQESPAFYQEALQSFRQNSRFFSRDELIGMYNHFMNYCIARINRGESVFLEEIFTLYGFQLEQGLLLEEDILSEWDYKNIVTTGIRLGKLEWVLHFIETYKSKLNPEVVENAYRFNLASCCYAMGQYDRVLDLLIQVEYSDLRYSLGAKALLLRTYYDLEEFEPLFSLAESFRQYLQRNKLLADVRRVGYYNMFKIARKAAQLKSRLDYLKPDKAKAELEKIKKDMRQTADIYNRSWLEEKVAELETAIA
ncbi:MAG: hypothetical protein IPH94_19750 [Saprospiraceae bacterium]|nr:hypothetical protein [Saprospiraceae bacterium]